MCVTLLAIAACGDALGPDGQVQLAIEFHTPEPGVEPPTVGVTALEVGIAITGRLQLPVPCYSVTDTSFTASERNLTLEIHATRDSGACFDVFANMSFDALITGLSPNRYNVEVQLHRDAVLQMRYAETLLLAGES